MKIAIPARQNNLESEIDERFGRCKGFILFDTQTGEHTWLPNEQSVQSSQGAGIQSAKNVIDSGAEVLIASNVGPKAYSLLKASGVEVFISAIKPVSQIIADYKEGKLQKATGANVESHW